MGETHAVSTPARQLPTVNIPQSITQNEIEAIPSLRRFQLDLLILTSMNENETLHWRPTWFHQEQFATRTWVIHNPPNVVTGRLPHQDRGCTWYIRRARDARDREPYFIKTWEHWNRYCDLYGTPHDFLCADHLTLLYLGHRKDQHGNLCVPPHFPLYPEPQPLGQGSYCLSLNTYETHLPKTFHGVNHAAMIPADAEVVVVQSNGALTVKKLEHVSMDPKFQMRFDGYGNHRPGERDHGTHSKRPSMQGKGRKWSYLPWTEEQEKSCRPIRLKLVLKGGDTKSR